MYKYLFATVVFIAFLFPPVAEAQNPPQINQPTILYPAPTAMEYQKYGDYPVSNYTGVPDITIPLYTIKEGDITLPITMTYHASGIKVSDPSGFFGVGWTLNTGGLVTNTQIGNDEVNNPFPSNVPTAASINPCSWNAYSPTLVQMEQMEQQGDYEHDIFFYNLGSESGKFYVQGNPATIASLYPYRPIKVNPYPGGWNTFEIIDEKGIQHYFGQYGSTGCFDPSGAYTWYASSIVSGLSDSNQISFKYSAPVTEFRFNRSDSWTKDDLPPFPWIAPSSDLPYFAPDLETGAASTTVTQYGYTGLPTEIDFSLGKIIISYNSTTNQLSGMTIYKADGSVYQSIVFSIVPFANQPPNTPSTPLWYKLASIKFYDGSGNFINQYQFGYNPNALPPYTQTNAIDYWGYYNNKPNTDLMPKDPNMQISDDQYSTTTVSVGGADRTSDGYYMQAMSLDTIVYPTGGMSVFIFEANQYQFGGIIGAAGGLRVKQITNYDYPGHVAQVKTYTYSGGSMDVLPSVSNYYYNQLGCMNGDNQIDWIFRRTIYSSDPDVDLAPHGSPVVYSDVTETITDGTNTIGSTDYFYDVEQASYTTFPAVFTNTSPGEPVMNYKSYRFDQRDWDLGGELTEKIVWDKNNNVVSDEQYNYADHIRDSLLNFKEYRFAVTLVDPTAVINNQNLNQNLMDYYASCNPSVGAILAPYAYASYYDITGEKRLMSRDVYLNDQRSPGAGLMLDTHTDYQYGNDVHDQPTQETKTDSKGRVVQTNYKYPADFSSVSPYNEMLAQNKQTEVVQQDQYVNSGFMQTVKTNYQDWGNGVIAPASVQVQKLNGPLENRLVYGGYDGRGNVLSAYKPGDMPISYIWDYRHLRPIAQVKNGSVTDIAYTSFEADGQGNWSFAGTPQADASAVTGKQSYNLGSGSVTRTGLNAGTTYIVSYWSKGGAYGVTGGNSLTTGRTSSTGWTYYEHSVTSQTSITVSGSGQIDELRLYPATAQMSTFTYDPLVGETSMCDASSKIVYYQYDAMGRLDMILDQDKNIVKKYAYSYQQPIAQGKGPNWQQDGNSRYVPCSINPAFNSQEIQYEQKDLNPLSATYNQTQWVDGGMTTTTWASDWQWTNNYQCVQDNGQNTGEQLRQQVYANPCSNIYNLTKWVSLGTNTTACPLPSNFTSDDESGYYYSENCTDPAQPDAVYVSVPAGMFTSSVSLGDADNQAVNYAQNIANQQGTCTIPNFTINWDDQSGMGAYYMDMTNEATGVTYSYSIPAYYYAALSPTIPAGTYDIHIYTIDDAWSFMVSIGVYSASGTDNWIYGVSMNTGENDTVYIN